MNVFACYVPKCSILMVRQINCILTYLRVFQLFIVFNVRFGGLPVGAQHMELETIGAVSFAEIVLRIKNHVGDEGANVHWRYACGLPTQYLLYSSVQLNLLLYHLICSVPSHVSHSKFSMIMRVCVHNRYNIMAQAMLLLMVVPQTSADTSMSSTVLESRELITGNLTTSLLS